MLFKVFLHEMLQKGLTIFSATTDGQVTSPLTASVYHTNLFLNSGFVFVPLSDQLNPMLGLHFYFYYFLRNSYLTTWTGFPAQDPACRRLLCAFLSAHQLTQP